VTAVTTAGLLAGLFGSAFVPAVRAAAGDGFGSTPTTPILEVIEAGWYSSTDVANMSEVCFAADPAADNATFTYATASFATPIILDRDGTTAVIDPAATEDIAVAGRVATAVTAADLFTSAVAGLEDRACINATPIATVGSSSTIVVAASSTATNGTYAMAAQSATPVARVSAADVTGTNSASQVAGTGNYVVVTIGDNLVLGAESSLDITVANGTIPTSGFTDDTAADLTFSRNDSTNVTTDVASAGTVGDGAFRVVYGGSPTSTVTISGVKNASGVLTRATLQTITITWTAAAVSGVPTTADSDAGIDDDAGWASAASASGATILAEDCSRATLGCDAKAATASVTSVFFGAVYAYDGNEALVTDTTKKWAMSLSGTAGQLKLASGAFTRSAEVAFDVSGRTLFEIAGNGVAGNTTLTITYGGVTYASFTVSFFGTVNSIEKNGQSNYAIVKTDGTTTSVLTVKGLDSAGVNVDLTLADGAPSVADSRFTATEALTGVAGDVDVLIDCNGYTGTSTATWTLTGKNAISTTFTCSTNAVSDINVSFETASVAVGGTAYVVVELLDAAGLPVPDAVTLVAANYKSIAVANGLINPSSLLTTSALATAPDAAAATSTKLTVENGKFKIPFYATTGGTGTFTMTVAIAEWDASAPLADVTYTASIKIGTSANSIEAGPKKKVATANFGATAAGGRIAFTIENTAGTTRTYYRKANASGVATYKINRAGSWTVYASYGDDITDSVTLRK
jgi:hypothetical protein